MAEYDENAPNVRNKSLLEQIRAKGTQSHVDRQSGSGVSNGYAEGRTSLNGENTTSGIGNANRDARGAQGAAEIDRAADGLHQRVRPPKRPRVNSDQGVTPGYRESERPVSEPTFQLKNPFKLGEKEPAKLFTKQEVELEMERMVEIYFHGSGILDDILEIIVKGHEEVQIWQLERSEAEMLAKMHLSRAQVDKASAASARQMLAMYDRLYVWMLAIPRAKATFTHVKDNGGLSFR